MEPTQKWAELLHSATTKLGTLQQAYSNFWNYSTGNQMLALMQCAIRGIEPGPIASYRKWQELGRQVRKGQKALSLWMPMMIKKRTEDKSEPTDNSEGNSAGFATAFVVRNNWFLQSQTDRKEFNPPNPPGWEREKESPYCL